MSYYNNNGYQSRKRYRNYDDDPQSDKRRRSRGGGHYSSSPQSRSFYNNQPQTPGYTRLKTEIWHMGDHSSIDERHLQQWQTELVKYWQTSETARQQVLETFTVGVVELPHKSSYLLALLALLHANPCRPRREYSSKLPAKPKEHDDTEDVTMEDSKEGEEQPVEKINVGNKVLEELLRKLSDYVEKEEWLSAKLSLIFLARCTHLPSPIVTLESFTFFLSQFVHFIKDTAAPLSLKDQIAAIVGEALLFLKENSIPQVQRALLDHAKGSQDALYDIAVQPYTENRFHNLMELLASAQDGKIEFKTPYINPFDLYPSMLDVLANRESKPFEIPALSIPFPKVTRSPYFATSTLKLFPTTDETVPEAQDAAGYLLYALIRDIMLLFQSNRNEGSRILIELSKDIWLKESFFKVKKEDTSGGTWILEQCILETLLSMSLAVPEAPSKPIYFTALLVELCKLAPGSVAPAMGKCVRRMYSTLGNADDEVIGRLDPEGLRRFADWFATHLSNFNFSWRWPEWESDLALPAEHPKRVFMDRLIETEIRLAYFERIKKSIPEPFQHLDVLTIDPTSYPQAYTEDHSLYSAAEEILELIRSKATAESLLEVISRTEANISDPDAPILVTDLVIHCLMQTGSSSISHFLNLLERYMPVFKAITSIPARKQKALEALSTFFGRNHLFTQVAIDKMMRYRVLDPIDVVRWSLNQPNRFLSLFSWEVLTGAIDLLNTRVNAVTIRLEADQAENARMSEGERIDTEQTETQLAGLVGERKNAVLESVSALRKNLALADLNDNEKWFNNGWLNALSRKYAELLSLHSGDISENNRVGVVAEVVEKWPMYTSLS